MPIFKVMVNMIVGEIEDFFKSLKLVSFQVLMIYGVVNCIMTRFLM
jgi:hypothetical protein